MNINSYKEIARTPEKQAEFLNQVVESVQANKPDGETLQEFMRRTIQVGSKPFDQVLHLVSLESESDGWDFDETSDAVKASLVRSSHALREMDRGYDIPHFIYGFHMVEEMYKDSVAPKAEIVSKPEPESHDLSF